MSLMTKRTASLVSDGEDFNAAFRDIIDREFPALEGRQSPQVMVFHDGGDFSHGERAVELARRFGVTLMPWQREQVMQSLATDADGRWLHSDIVLLCPRQNGKSLILEVIILYRLFVLNHQVVFSAHQWRTAKSIRNRIWRRIKSKPWAERRLVRNTASAGEAEMETREGGKLQFSTRSNDMGRGFDQIDLLLLDEAYNLESGELDAVAPTQLAAEDPQTFYTSSAVNSEKHAKGEELSRIRERALGEDNENVFFSEFCAPEGMDIDDPLTWRLANPSYGIVATEKKVRSVRSKLTDTGFEVEMLGWGRWFTQMEDFDETIISLDVWEALYSDNPPVSGDSCIGIDTTPDGESVGMVAAQQASGAIFVTCAPVEHFDRDSVVESVRANVEANNPVAVVLDPSGPASTIVDPLEKMGVTPEVLGGGKVSQAYELLLRLIDEGKIIHDGSERLTAAWAVAQERSSAGRYRSFERFVGDVSTLVAMSFAVWGLQEFGIPEEAPDVEKKVRYTGRAKAIKRPRPAAALAF